MDENQAKKNIDYIKEMIDKTREATSAAWQYFILWGTVVILGILGMHLLVYLEKFQYIWLNWVGFSAVGVATQFILVRKDQQRRTVMTYAQNAIAHLGFSGGLGYLLVGILFPILKLYSIGVIPVLISVITGIIIFTIGGIVEWNYLKWCGLTSLVMALLMVFIHWHYRSLLLIPLIALSYLVPGYKLYKQSKETGNT